MYFLTIVSIHILIQQQTFVERLSRVTYALDVGNGAINEMDIIPAVLEISAQP